MPLDGPRALLRDIAEVGVAQPEIRVAIAHQIECIESIEKINATGQPRSSLLKSLLTNLLVDRLMLQETTGNDP